MGLPRATADDWLAIVELTSAMGLLIDACDWAALTGLFAETVEVDYTSLNGGEPATLPREELIAGWRAIADGLDATQHLIGNHQVTVEGNTASCAANVLATHRLATLYGAPLWTVGGRYDYGLRRAGAGEPWRISAVTFTPLWASGNRTIMQLAVEKSARTGSRREAKG